MNKKSEAIVEQSLSSLNGNTRLINFYISKFYSYLYIYKFNKV